MKIEQFIKKDFITASPFAGVTELKMQLLQHSAIIIIEEDQYFGVLTTHDLIRKPHILAFDCLHTKSPINIDCSVDAALQLMQFENTEVLPVFKENKIFGLLFRSDILDYLRTHNKELQNIIQDQAKKIVEQNSEFKDKIEQQKIELENIIEQRTKELIDLVETKDKFIQIIAQELRNPFASILGLLTLLQKNIRKYDVEKIENYLTHIYNSTTVTFDLLVNLLEWLNVKNKKLPFNPENVCISKLLTEEIINTSQFAEQKQITIKHNIAENIYVFVDKNMVKTIFGNLLNNAIKFTEIKGEIFISSKEVEQFIEISVKDTGFGLSLEIIEKLFKVEGINSLKGTANETGSGLGLLLCKEFVEIEGGKIWVESIVNDGTEFKFTLPKSIEKS